MHVKEKVTFHSTFRDKWNKIGTVKRIEQTSEMEGRGCVCVVVGYAKHYDINYSTLIHLLYSRDMPCIFSYILICSHKHLVVFPTSDSTSKKVLTYIFLLYVKPFPHYVSTYLCKYTLL